MKSKRAFVYVLKRGKKPKGLIFLVCSSPKTLLKDHCLRLQKKLQTTFKKSSCYRRVSNFWFLTTESSKVRL